MIYARRVATLGVSHEETVRNGCNLAGCLVNVRRWDDAKALMRDQLLPAARRSLGADHYLTLGIGRNLAAALQSNPEHSRDDPCENQHRSVRGVES